MRSRQLASGRLSGTPKPAVRATNAGLWLAGRGNSDARSVPMPVPNPVCIPCPRLLRLKPCCKRCSCPWGSGTLHHSCWTVGVEVHLHDQLYHSHNNVGFSVAARCETLPWRGEAVTLASGSAFCHARIKHSSLPLPRHVPFGDPVLRYQGRGDHRVECLGRTRV